MGVCHASPGVKYSDSEDSDERNLSPPRISISEKTNFEQKDQPIRQQTAIADDIRALFEVFNVDSVSIKYQYGRYLERWTVFWGETSVLKGLYQLTHPETEQKYVVKSYRYAGEWLHEQIMHQTLETCYSSELETLGFPRLIASRNKYLVFPCYAINRLNGHLFFEQLLQNKLIGVASAIYNLRRIGIFHRDIKRDNIVFHKNSKEKFSPILIDYGLALVQPFMKSKDYTLCQTTAYRAPEVLARQILNESNSYNFLIEEWSLGMCSALFGEKDIDSDRQWDNPSFVHFQQLKMEDEKYFKGQKSPFLEKIPGKRLRIEHFLNRCCLTQFDICLNNWYGTRSLIKRKKITFLEGLCLSEFVESWFDFFYVLTFFAQLDDVELTIEVFQTLHQSFSSKREKFPYLAYSINHPYFFLRHYLLEEELEQILDQLIWLSLHNFTDGIGLQTKYLLSQAGRLVDFLPAEEEELREFWQDYQPSGKNLSKVKNYFILSKDS